MVFNRYYQDELAYLRELGQEFAKAHPAVAPMLAGPGSDPDVERLLEGVAFLTAKLRLKLDDEFPEILHSLMEILWPHYLKPVPSMTTVQFYPGTQLKEAVAVPAMTSLDSVPVEGTTCRFRTCRPVKIIPLAIEDAGFEERSTARSRLVLEFAAKGGELGWDLSGDEGLEIYLHGDYSIMAALYLLFMTALKEVRLEVPGQAGGVSLDPERCLRPSILARAHGLLPYPPQTFEGYRYLLEYFLYPSSFLYVDLKVLDRLRGLKGSGFRCHFVFNQDFPHASQIGPENFRLFATPAVNIFRYEADPIKTDLRKVEYLVRPTGHSRHHYAVYSVEEVVGWVPGTVERHVYRPVFSFDAPGEGQEAAGYYQLAIRPAVSWEGVETYISFLDHSLRPEAPGVKNVALALLCTNANLPLALMAGDIRLPTADTPELVSFENITKPTGTIWPPIEQGVLWRLVSHLSLNHLSLGRVEHLKGLLSLYNLHNFGDQSAARANELKIQGVRSIATRPVRMLFKGYPLSGLGIELEASGKNFAGPGDLYLFGQALNEFFSLYCHINTFSRLTLREAEQATEYRWPARLGKKQLL